MAYYSASEMKSLLDEYPDCRAKLYCRGFLITEDEEQEDLNSFPFYGNWQRVSLTNGYYLNHHKDVKAYVYSDATAVHFLIGHAYNPYTLVSSESEILKALALALQAGKEIYWNKESELTGVFCIGYIMNGEITISTDCTGMQLIFCGSWNGHCYICSHAKLLADRFGFEQTPYIKRLVNSRFYHYWGTWLPADLSPYNELRRILPNFAYRWKKSATSFEFYRYFPNEIIHEVSQEDAGTVFEYIAQIMRNNLHLIAEKWGNRAAISVTGGRDSTATLASASEDYDVFRYFSYISNPSEQVDAEAAHQICEKLGLPHIIYQIPNQDEAFPNIEVYRKILECNAGCIGTNNKNDVRKRIFFDKNNDFDLEVKSWVGELGRAEAHNKYDMKKWPSKPTPGYYRCMWKLIIDPILIHNSNKIFKQFLDTYYNETVLSQLPWMDLFFWEFSWGGGEGTFLTAEHKISYDITIPFNNRKLLSTVFSIPFNQRLDNKVPIKIIEINNKAINHINVNVINASHTKRFKANIRTYLRLFSKL